MTNNYYTAFYRKPSDPEYLEELLTETKDKTHFEKAIERAKKQGFIITRIYKPDTEIIKPDFIAYPYGSSS